MFRPYRDSELIVGFLLTCFLMMIPGAVDALAPDARERGIYDTARQLSDEADQGFAGQARAELESYVRQFPRGRYLDDVYLRLARAHLSDDEPRLAAARLLQVVIICRGSLREATARDELNKLLDSRRFRADRARYDRALERYGNADDAGARRMAYTNALLMIDDESMLALVGEQAELLLESDAQDEDLAFALFAVGDFQRRHQSPKAAVATFQRISHLWSNSPVHSRALLAAGEVLEKNLSQPIAAMERYRVIVRDHPQQTEAASAWFRLGEIERRQLKRYEIALRNYDEILKRYPEHPDAFAAMLARAETLIEGFRDYRGAIEELVRGASRYQAHTRAPEALDRAGQIAERDLRDPQLAAGYYADLAERFPSYEPAPDRLLRGGELLEKDADPAGARRLYLSVVERYPGGKQAAKARKRIDKLSENPAR